MTVIESTPVEARTFTSPWLDTGDAALYLSMSPKTLAVWRSQGKGPEYRLVGGRMVRYHVNDLDAFARGEVQR